MSKSSDKSIIYDLINNLAVNLQEEDKIFAVKEFISCMENPSSLKKTKKYLDKLIDYEEAPI